MSNDFFLILFSLLAYANCRYFSYLIHNHENYQDRGILNQLFIGRLLFFLGLPILGIFIFNLIQIDLSGDSGSLLKSCLMIVIPIIILIAIEVIYKKNRGTDS